MLKLTEDPPKPNPIPDSGALDNQVVASASERFEKIERPAIREPSEEIPNTSENSINLINFNDLDIITIETKIDCLFEAAPNQYVVDSKVYLDGEEISVDWQNNTGSFNLRPSRYTDGTHEIRVQLFFTSGSGSLKDQSGLEILEKNQIFKFIVKRNPAEPPKINEVKMETLKMDVHMVWMKVLENLKADATSISACCCDVITRSLLYNPSSFTCSICCLS